ncbi:MAG: ATP-binding protein of ABC transporter [Candidatus Ozemobacter sibiricus]|jgi:putative ABC transport system ATP-binding protein|uniref:ATP-binding protein of ABC transporter n=1 Tax=Candidatus Ozemobacter sibiricus TaxID=2268124 RepID=A0A367ZP59_9BACT|nr:MAG: ATP-binding protein of ABC transporter [Candidatus Ozemobacter sibiricus]
MASSSALPPAAASAAPSAPSPSGGGSAGPWLIEIRGLHKTYFMEGVDVKALKGIDLTIAAGEFACIMGASGSGKSTMMNILGCLDRPTRGQYFLAGQDVSTLSNDELAEVRNKRIGFVFQGFNLLTRTSALENVEMPMVYAGVPAAERHRRAMAALAAVGLAGREHHYSNQLSGGQQQRVAIARALVNQPSLILADEPTGNLDSRSSIEIMGIFQDLNAKGITIVLITHEPDISRFARRRILLKDGRLISDAPITDRLDAAEELANLPRDPEHEEE